MADAGPLSQLVARMVADRQLSAADVLAMSARPASAPDGSEAAVLRWLLAKGVTHFQRRTRPHRAWRERKAHVGALLQLDGSRTMTGWRGERPSAA